MFKLKDISDIVNVPIGILLVYATFEKEYSEIVIALALIAFILYIVFLVHRFDPWSKITSMFYVFKLNRKVPELADKFADIGMRFDEYTIQANYGNIFSVSSNKSIRDGKFDDCFAIFEKLRNAFLYDIYKHFTDESTSFSNRRIKKKEDFVGLLILFGRVLYYHECIINNFLGLVEKKRYNKEIYDDVAKEFTEFKENYNRYLDDCKKFMERVNRKLGADVKWNIDKISDETSVLFEKPKVATIVS
ncbi:MAG: hypothetical protein EF813_01315 [Methanosarcinales archaeon]|nr:MAG: hypothetical protein EF813_01315 [Methanosarcinales archaeon]